MRDIDETLPFEVQLEQAMAELETVEAKKEEPYYNKHRWEDVPSELLGDPEHNAFPCDTKARALAALRYLAKYYNNPSAGGVTAGYSKEDFKRVHDRIVRILKNKYGVEHDECVICQKKKRGEASLEEAKAYEEIKMNYEKLLEDYNSLKERIEKAEAENQRLQEIVAQFQYEKRMFSRASMLAEKGVEIPEEKMEAIANLEDEIFDLLISLLPNKVEASEENVSKEGEQTEESVAASEEIQEEAAEEKVEATETVEAKAEEEAEEPDKADASGEEVKARRVERYDDEAEDSEIIVKTSASISLNLEDMPVDEELVQEFLKIHK